jgi:hypothetical protein
MKVKGRDVFNAHAIEDREGLETRDGMQPTGLLVFLAQLPVEQGGVTEVVFSDGQTYRVRNGAFSYPLARALHLRATRVPLYLVKAQAVARPEWLRQHLEEGVIAVLPEDDTRLIFPGELCSGYALHYRSDLGVSHEKEALQIEPSCEEEFWY